ncbi:MAG: calcium-binding EGF-like domain-containing protein [Polyangiaceae bacterium]
MTNNGWRFGVVMFAALSALRCTTNEDPFGETGGAGGTSTGGAAGAGGTGNGVAGTQSTAGSGGASGGVGGASSGVGGTGGSGVDAGMDASEDAGPSCDPDHFGPTCEACACGPNGDCDDGIDGTGACSCDAGWTGEHCDTCASGHYGSSCSICTCNVHGTCDEGSSGTGACACDDGWGGTNCQTCAPSRYGSNCESTCPVCTFGECEAGQTGSGKCCITVGIGEHVNQDFAGQTGAFTVEWDGIASAQTDGIFGLTVDDTANDWDDFAVAARFSPMGLIDARDGGAYNHDAFVPYTAGTEYHFRMAVDLTTHKYSLWVTPSGGAEVQIAQDYAFRPNLNTVTELRNAAARTQTNVKPIQICNFEVVGN